MNRRLNHPLGASLLILVSLLGCSPSKPAASPGTVVQPLVGGLDENNFRRMWMDILPLDKSDGVDRVWVNEDMVMACTPNNVVYTVNNSNGVLRYFRYVDGHGRRIGTPVVLPDSVVFPGQSNLEVYGRKGGDLTRSINLGFTISSDAVGIGTELYLGADLGGGEIAHIDVTDPYRPVQWQLLTFGEVRGAPAYRDGIVYVGSGDGNLRAINTDRQPVWFLDKDSYDTGGAILGDVKADDLSVYAASVSGRLVCLDRSTGQLKWQYFAPHALESGPVLTRTTVYQVVPAVGLVAFDKTKFMAVDPGGKPKVPEMNRTPRWSCPEAEQFVSEDSQFTYVRAAGNQLWALDRQTGQVRYRGTHGHFSSMATNVNDSTIYAATGDGVLYAIKPMLQPGNSGYLE